MIERLFKLSENKTSVRTEVLAGCCISFLCRSKMGWRSYSLSFRAVS